MTLILASASPRRQELLAQAGYAFKVHAADIDESQHPQESPLDYVRRLALEKAKAVWERHPESVVLGADTTVVLDGEVLGKPPDRQQAAAMLRALSGRAHMVHTGVAVVRGGNSVSHVETTKVVFGDILADDLATYLETGDSLDKAGGYGIQGYAARWIIRIEGDYFNVMGLPIAATVGLLRRFL